VEERATAVKFAQLLQKATKQKSKPASWLSRELKRVTSLRLDYVEVAGDRLCAAVFVGKTRLIDNERLVS